MESIVGEIFRASALKFSPTFNIRYRKYSNSWKPFTVKYGDTIRVVIPEHGSYLFGGIVLVDIQWKVGMAVSSDSCRSLNSPFVMLNLTVADTAGQLTTHNLELTIDQFIVRSQHHDLVLNGSEVGGGSIRIHNPQDQIFVLQDVLKEDASELRHLLEAFTTGCPPHGGLALGLDRLIAIMCGAQSIRDVISFPKSVGGRDLMSKAPAEISKAEMDMYHIQVVESSDSMEQEAIKS